MSRPFFTIGITTYNRRELLSQTLASVLAQTFGDFEVIVGNDYPDEILNAEMFGISDRRVRFVNHPRNLREVGNMNALLDMASGRYFTWLADDDFYPPYFLQASHDILAGAKFPPCFFSSYKIFRGKGALPPTLVLPCVAEQMNGREFLRKYFDGRLKVISVYGLFDTDYLRKIIGGMEPLCFLAIGVHSEYHFLVKCALFERIVYTSVPLVLYRAHDRPWSGGSAELDSYREAGQELVRRCGEVLRNPSLSADLTKNLLSVCGIHLYEYAGKLGLFYASGKGAFLEAIVMLFAETGRMRRALVEAGGSDGFRGATGFVWIFLKCSLLFLVRVIFVKWIRKPRAHD